jgi:alkylation response protein AidB-like acyl-CoA dehydrogenase
MGFELQPTTEPGRRFVAQAEAHARDFATRADEHDRGATFPLENMSALRRSGFTAATVPHELGGWGLDSVLDYAIGIARLGRGDGSTALAANMHVFRTWFVARAWRASQASGEPAAAKRSAELLRGVAGGEVVLAAILSEAGTDHLHIRTEATRVDGGWRINGRKAFGTGSPGATVLGILVRYPGAGGEPRVALAHVPATAPGVEIKHNWDALGMRGSGSHDIVFTDCFVPDEDLADTGPWGRYTERYLAGNAVGTLGLVAVFLGIAECARDTILETIAARGSAGRHAVQQGVAEMEIALATSRAMVERSGRLMDAFFARHGHRMPPLAELHELMLDFQCTKAVVTQQAIVVVDRALTLSGGSGYLSKNPLSRLYRDVRAGPFMQPFSPYEALEYIGRVTLGVLEES